MALVEVYVQPYAQKSNCSLDVLVSNLWNWPSGTPDFPFRLSYRSAVSRSFVRDRSQHSGTGNYTVKQELKK